MSNTAKQQFATAERRNWGYWDGVADADKGRMPVWSKPGHNAHPFDAAYGEGYWAGRYGNTHPNRTA